MQLLKATEVYELMKGKACHFHLVGVAGSGMSGLAALLLARGHRVCGSDLKTSPVVERLIQQGLCFFKGHHKEHIKGSDVLVFSSAIDEHNEERMEAAAGGTPQATRAEVLAALCEDKKIIAVAGAHGKTTSASMLTHVLKTAGLDPSFYIGAEVPLFGTNAAWGKGEIMVVEVDESDGTIDAYKPTHALVLNIEREHLDYFQDMDQIRQAFRSFVARTTGTIVFCADDPEAKQLLQSHTQGISYGFSELAACRIEQALCAGSGSRFDLLCPKEERAHVTLNVPGKHNVSNASGVFALAHSLGVPAQTIVEALASFHNARRRFEVVFENEKWMVVDDYAHHPTEIRATLAAAKGVGKKRILVLFQPHRYSRTKHLYSDFLNAFEGADMVYLTEIYAASEKPIEGVRAEQLAQDISKNQPIFFYRELEDARAAITQTLEEGDLLLVMGAGDVEQVSIEIARDLRLYQTIASVVGPESVVRPFEPMKKHTTMRIGGPATIWCEPASEEELACVVKYCTQEKIPLIPIGRGSNLLVKDRGIHGVCVHLSKPAFQRLEVKDGKIEAGAGVRLKQIVVEAKRAGVGGLEFMEGIPAALGGALRMNAGAMDSWTFEVIESVRVMKPSGEICSISAQDIEVHYRHVPLFDTHIALSAVLRGKQMQAQEISEKLNSFSKKRWASQPAAPSAGCIFKNPSHIGAGRLIDELGLKDTRRGGARISPVHGNFIVNEGGATAADVLELIDWIKRQAKEKRAVELQTEVIILGE